MSKKIIACIMTLVIVLSLSAMTANAATGKITCGSNVATLQLLATSKTGSAKTTSNKKAEYLQTFIVATKVNSKGQKVTPDMNSSYDENTTDSGWASKKAGSGYKYTKVISTHGVKFSGYVEKAENLTVNI